MDLEITLSNYKIYLLIDFGLILFAVLFKHWILSPLGFFSSNKNKKSYRWFFILFIILFCTKIEAQEPPESISNFNAVFELDFNFIQDPFFKL